MVTTTTNYSLKKPTVGGDDSAWGGQLNDSMDLIDAALDALQTQIDTLNTAAEARKIPIGGLYLSATDTDPAATLGYGTWVAHAAGRALIGVGSNGESNWPVDRSVGSEVHLLTEAQIPAHTHQVNPPATTASTSSAGAHTHSNQAALGGGGTAFYGFGLADGNYSSIKSVTVNSAGNHNHSITLNIPEFTSAAKGGGQSHNNIQPSLAVYVWRRTA